MKIDRVRYDEVRALDRAPGSNVRIGVEAEVEDGESRETVLAFLRQWVDLRFKEMAEDAYKKVQVQRDIVALQQERSGLQDLVALAHADWIDAQELLKAHGVTLKKWPDPRRPL